MEIIEWLPVYSVDVQHLKDIEKIATERDLNFYDASYAYVAEEQDLKLITEDEDLLRKCKNSITLDRFLKNKQSELSKKQFQRSEKKHKDLL